MNASGIRAGDIVHLDVRGQRTFARVVAPVYRDDRLRRRVLEVEPLKMGPNFSLPTRFPTPRQVVGHYAKRKGSIGSD